jgi:hypothetical protein
MTTGSGRIARIGASVVVLGATAAVLMGCAIARPVTDPVLTEGFISPTPSPTASGEAPAPVTEQPPPEDDAVPDPVASEQGQQYAPPAEWTEEELVGACKSAGPPLPVAQTWEDMSSDPTFEQQGDRWIVTFASLASDRPLVCDVSGTPTEPVVVLS